jgi:hypothetical protein
MNNYIYKKDNMTHIIRRAKISASFSQKYLKEADKIVNDIEGHLFDSERKSIGWLAYKVYMGAQIAIVEDKRSHEEIWRYLGIAKDLFVSNFTTVKYKGTKPYIHIDGKRYRIDTSVKYTGEEEFDTFYDPYWWLTAFSLCQLLGDVQKRSYLIDVTKHMMKKSNRKHLFLDLEFAFIDALKGMYLEISGEKKVDRIEKAYEISLKKPKYYDDKHLGYAEYVVFGWQTLIELLILPLDQERFTEKMTEVIQDHKDYYKQYDHDLSPEVWTNFIVMMLVTSNISQHGYTLEIETEYLPTWILEKSLKVLKVK